MKQVELPIYKETKKILDEEKREGESYEEVIKRKLNKK